MAQSTKKKFAFIVHCRNTRELRLVAARYRLSPRSLLPERQLKDYCFSRGFIEDIFTFKNVVTDRGAACQGKAFCLLLTPDQMIENQAFATDLVIQASRMAQDWGAEMIGLGAICAVIGARGVEVAENCTAAVTTGNSLTAHASVVAYDKLMQRLEADPRQHRAVLVGFPGSIILVIAKVLHERGIDLVLVSRRKTAFLRKFLDSLGSGRGSVEITQDIPTALKKGRIVFSATSAGRIIDPDLLLPGSVVFDIAQPKDVIYRQGSRQDVLIIDAGIIKLPRATTDRYRYSGLMVNEIPSCLGETMVLTLEQRWENFSLGRELHLDKAREIGRLAEEHGFIFDNFRTFTRPIPEQSYEATRQALNRPG